MPRSRVLSILSLATSLVVPAAYAQNTNTAGPGTINYIEGQATLNGQPLAAKSSGAALAQGGTLETTNGKVEVLLTPGVFLRIGDNSAVTMVSPELAKTEVRVDRGTAEVEVDQVYKQNNLLVDNGSTQTKLVKKGLYEFDANAGEVRVFEGEAQVSLANDASRPIKVKGHHVLALNGAEKPQSFSPEDFARNDSLYSWSKLRSDYLGQANQELAQQYAGQPGFYPGWFWAPGLYSYTWLPGDGLFWSPFGSGFYSPYYLYGGGLIYPHYGIARGYIHAPHRGYVRGGFADRGTMIAPHRFGGGVAHAGGFHGGGFGHAGGGFHGGGRR
jgi:hypothetical protein